MSRQPLPPTAAVLRFIDCVNGGDLEGLGDLMSDDHRLVVLDEPPIVGREANLDAWNGYFSAFPDYVIYPRHIATSGLNIAVLGTTTGSHLGLPDEDEMLLDVIWLAETSAGRLTLWQVAGDSPSLRERTGIPSIC